MALFWGTSIITLLDYERESVSYPCKIRVAVEFGRKGRYTFKVGTSRIVAVFTRNSVFGANFNAGVVQCSRYRLVLNWTSATDHYRQKKKRRDRVSRYPSPERLFEFASLFAEVRLIGRYLLPIIELILHEYCLKNTEFPKNCTYYRLYILVTTARFLSNRSWDHGWISPTWRSPPLNGSARAPQRTSPSWVDF